MLEQEERAGETDLQGMKANTILLKSPMLAVDTE